MLVDRKERHYVLILHEGASFHTHAGIVAHDEIIGRSEGITVRSTHGSPYIVLRPTLADADTFDGVLRVTITEVPSDDIAIVALKVVVVVT